MAQAMKELIGIQVITTRIFLVFWGEIQAFQLRWQPQNLGSGWKKSFYYRLHVLYLCRSFRERGLPFW